MRRLEEKENRKRSRWKGESNHTLKKRKRRNSPFFTPAPLPFYLSSPIGKIASVLLDLKAEESIDKEKSKGKREGGRRAGR